MYEVPIARIMINWNDFQTKYYPNKNGRISTPLKCWINSVIHNKAKREYRLVKLRLILLMVIRLNKAINLQEIK